MKHLLFLVFSLASASCFAQEALSNGGMPKDSPPSLLVERVPMGSGVPSIGQTTGYSTAAPVADGLYHVPGYLPGRPNSFAMWPRVVDVKCNQKEGTWYCSGYHIDGVLERGEDIYVRPVFEKVSEPAPVAPLVQQQEPPACIPVTPVPHPHVHHVVKPHPKKLCN